MEEARRQKRELENKLEEQKGKQDALACELAAARSSNLPHCQDPQRLNQTNRDQFLAFAELRKNQEIMNNILEKHCGDDSTEDFMSLNKVAQRNTQLMDLRLAAFQAAASSPTNMKAEFVTDYCRRLAPKIGAKDGKWGPGGEKKFAEIQGKVVNEVEKYLANQASSSGGGGGRGGGHGGGRGGYHARGAYNQGPGGFANQGRGGGGRGRGAGNGGGGGGANPAQG